MTLEHAPTPSRRRALRQLGVGAAVAWVTPAIAAVPAAAAGTPSPSCPLCPEISGWTVSGAYVEVDPGVYELAGDGAGTLVLEVTYTDPTCGPQLLSISATVTFVDGAPAPVDLALGTLGDTSFLPDWDGRPVPFVAAPPTTTEPSFVELSFQTVAADPIRVGDVVARCVTT